MLFGAIFASIFLLTGVFSQSEEIVSYNDLNIVLTHFNSVCQDVTSECPGDYTHDGIVDQRDIEWVITFLEVSRNELVFEELDTCGVISESGTYVLTQDIRAQGECLRIEAPYVYLACNSHALRYGQSESGMGMYGRDLRRVAFSDCAIEQVRPFDNSDALQILDTERVFIGNVSIETKGDVSRGINADEVGELLVQGTITTSGDGSHGIDASSVRGGTVDAEVSTSGESHALFLEEVSGLRFSGTLIATGTGSAAHILESTNFLASGFTALSKGDEIFVIKGKTNAFVLNNGTILGKGKGLVIDTSSVESSHAGWIKDLNIVSKEGLVITSIDNASRLYIIDSSIKQFSFPLSGALITLSKSDAGSITFEQPVPLSGTDLENTMYIGPNFVQVLTGSEQPFYNPSLVTLMNIPSFVNPVILHNGAVCTDCVNVSSLHDETVMFSVQSWSNYTIAEADVAGENQAPVPDNDGGCVTSWSCSEWSECSEGQQNRVCSKLRSHCIVPSYLETPATIQTCELQAVEVASEEDSGFISTITGAVVGVIQQPGSLFIAAIFIATLIGLAVAVPVARMRTKR